MNRAQTLKKAEECVLKDRQATHGRPEDSFGLIAQFWSSYLGHPIKDYQVAVMMSLLKIARLKHKPLNDDNWVDGVGYLACGAELSEKHPVPESFWKGLPDPILDDHGNFKCGLGETRHTINSPAPLPATVLNEDA